MNRKYLMILILAITLIINACSTESNNNIDQPEKSASEHHSKDEMDMEHGHDHDEPELNDSTGENELKLPPLLERDKKEGNHVYYTIDAQKGQTEIFKGTQTNTLGYNTSFLGPVIQMEKGQTVHINTKNSLDEETTFHWHGLKIPGDADGGPHRIVKPGESKEITFKVDQDAATLWFHPHPMGNTAKQVYEGLAGFIYIEDKKENSLSLPKEYGKNDFPVIVQDKHFDKNKQLHFEEVKNEDGTTGDTLLVNGTLNPRLTVDKGKVRLRILNGSNMRNYVFKLSNNQPFQQIASDGGLLNESVSLTELQLTPSERAEIIVDFAQIKENENISLVTEDGTVVLPFKIKNTNTKEGKELQKQMNTISISKEDLKKKVSKKVELAGMGEDVTINGKKFDMNRIDFTQKKGETEIWEIYNKPDDMGGMIHPFHIHGTQFKIISINGKKPPANEQGYKDTVAIHPGDKIKLAVKFPHAGTYMYHCHILEHEDNGMMGQIKVE